MRTMERPDNINDRRRGEQEQEITYNKNDGEVAIKGYHSDGLNAKGVGGGSGAYQGISERRRWDNIKA